MNHWLANLTGFELNDPLFDYFDRLLESGKITAQKNFGMRAASFRMPQTYGCLRAQALRGAFRSEQGMDDAALLVSIYLLKTKNF